MVETIFAVMAVSVIIVVCLMGQPSNEPKQVLIKKI